MTVATFDPVAFKARYPEFVPVDNTVLTACFQEAGFYLSNKDNSPVSDISRRSLLLNMLTAHIAVLGGKLSADGIAKPVGRVASAGEGSVSVALEYMTPGTQAWFVQTQYGAAFWQATTSLRRFRYRPRAVRV